MKNEPELIEQMNQLKEEIRTLNRYIFEKDEIIQDLTSKNEKLQIQRDEIMMQVEKLTGDMRQTKIKYQINEEKKNENELSLKTEIKFLVNKLIKTKKKLDQANQYSEDIMEDEKLSEQNPVRESMIDEYDGIQNALDINDQNSPEY